MKLIDVALYLVYIATYIIVVPIGVGFYFYKNLPKTLKILLLGLCVVLLLDFLLLFFSLKDTNTFLYIFSVVDVLMLAWVYSLEMSHKKLSIATIITAFLIVVLIAFDAFFISGLKNIGFSNAIEKTFILFVAIYYLTQLFQENIESNLLKLPMFWLSIGVITFDLVGSFDIFNSAIMNYSQNLYLQYYLLLTIANIFMYGCFAYSFWLNRFNSNL